MISWYWSSRAFLKFGWHAWHECLTLHTWHFSLPMAALCHAVSWTSYSRCVLAVFSSAHGRPQADTLDARASTNFPENKLFIKMWSVTWISEHLTSNGSSKCRSLRTIIPPSRLWSRCIWYMLIYLLLGYYGYMTVTWYIRRLDVNLLDCEQIKSHVHRK